MGQIVVLKPNTADRLRRLLDRPDGDVGKLGPGTGGRDVVLVRCDSDSLSGGGGMDDECFPGTIVHGDATEVIADQPTGGDVWLSMTDGTLPTSGQTYVCVLSGDVEANSETRPRAFAQPAGTGGTTGDVDAYINAYSGSSGNSTGWEVWNSQYCEVPGPGDYLVTFTGQGSYTAGSNCVVSLAITYWDDGDPIPDAADSIPVIGALEYDFPSSVSPGRTAMHWTGVIAVGGTGPQRIGAIWDITSGSGWSASSSYVRIAAIPVTGHTA